MSYIREDLKAYVDGELSTEMAEVVAKAVASDPDLQKEVEFMKAIGFEIKRIKNEPAVVGAEETLARLRNARRPWWTRAELYVATGICAILAVIVFPVFAQSKEAARHSIVMSEAKSADTGVVSEAPAESGDFGGGGGAPARGMSGRNSRTETLPAKDKSIAGEESWAVASPNFPQLLIRTADIQQRVEDVGKARSETIRVVTSNGGFVSNDSKSGAEGQLPFATMLLRVPVKRFDAVCEAIRAMGTNVQDSTNTDDVTAQVADVEARLKVMRAEEESYVTMLRAARRVGELLEIKERLSQVRQEIESLDAQRKALRNQSAYSTINVTFTQKRAVGSPEPSKNWSEDAWANAVNGLTSALRWLGQVAITLFVYSPLWLPLILIGWWLNRRSRR